MAQVIKNGHTLQFASPPPSFNGVVETIMTSQTETAALMTELSDLLEKGAISRVPAGEERGFTPVTSLYQRKRAE